MSSAQYAATSGSPDAHSTVEVDGADSTEVWGVSGPPDCRVSGLAARADLSGITCEAAHDGFRHLPVPAPYTGVQLVADRRRTAGRGHDHRARATIQAADRARAS